jgi:hypothetical protein
VRVTRGTSNNLFQVATLVRAATALDATVDVLFSGAALVRMRGDSLRQSAWSDPYLQILPALEQRLREADFDDMERFLRDAKEHGDSVHYWAASETLQAQGLALRELTPLLDGARSDAEFTDQTAAAIVLTF